MFQDEDDVQQDSSPADEQAAESSTAEVTEPSEATEDQAVQEQSKPGPIPYERFQEVIQQKNQTAQEVEHWRNIATQLTEKFQQPGAVQPTQQEADIIQKYGAQDPATREFLREMKAEMRREAQKVGQELAAPILRENEALRRSVAQLQEKDFRQSNSDVAAGSPEEQRIAQYVAMGVPYNDAAMAVMGTKRIEVAQQKGKSVKTITSKAKIQATQETQSIPATSGLPQNSSLSFKEKMDRALRESGL